MAKVKVIPNSGPIMVFFHWHSKMNSIFYPQSLFQYSWHFLFPVIDPFILPGCNENCTTENKTLFMSISEFLLSVCSIDPNIMSLSCILPNQPYNRQQGLHGNMDTFTTCNLLVITTTNKDGN